MENPQGVRFSQMEQAILDVAGNLFEQKGFNQTSLQDIAEVLGMARPSLYHYFSNREQMLVAGISQVTTQRDQLLEQFRTAGGNPGQRLELLVVGLAQIISSNPVWIRVILRDDLALPDEEREIERRSRLAFFETLVGVLREGVEQGYVRPLAERTTALTIISALAGLQGHYAATTDDPALAATHLAVDIILHGILNQEVLLVTPIEQGLKLINDGVKLIERSR